MNYDITPVIVQQLFVDHIIMLTKRGDAYGRLRLV